ncbi:response regulator [Maridesulfovibrio frigidus]|uniref:response regulator n=1 Tax=Maridesulfovibrio frigidus TaxID=340956 RepID=UPI0004E0BC34|nr:response regulator [Maridesulfovibrio frigidus]
MAIDREMKFLIVDDNQGVRKITSDILRAVGFQNVIQAENGKLGWNKIVKDSPDFVILDWDMPVMNGIELLNKIRSSEDYQELPVLMLTAHAESIDVILAVQAGATNYIVKPFAPNTLYKKLHQIFGEPVR